MKGIIIKNISNNYTVKSNKGIYVCKARGKFRKDQITPLVGDSVEFDDSNNYILKISKRKNQLIRPMVANIDQAIIVTSVKDPNFDTVLLDKLLTIISYNNIKPIICISKLDLLNDKELKEIEKYINYYKKIGYDVIINKKSEFKDVLTNKLNVFTGQSGAGKSTILNLLDSKLELQTNEISKALGRGKHTTRHVELYDVMGGFVVDTPGFSSIDFHDMEPMDIRDNMKEMFDNLHLCKYRNCMHEKEDGCMIKKMVLDKEILESRYKNYISFIKRS